MDESLGSTIFAISGWPPVKGGSSAAEAALDAAIAWLQTALPERSHWRGPAAESCALELEQILSRLRELKYRMNDADSLAS